MVIRPIAVFLIVLWHAFIIYQGGWHKLENYTDVRAYWWIAKCSIIFSLELFTFVSGYVFAFQNSIKPKPYGVFIVGKIKRLLLPSIVFSILYLLVIRGVDSIDNYYKTTIDILCGIGHLWYLPMLFVVFAISYFIVKLNAKVVNVLMVILFAVATVILAVNLPYNIPVILYYLPFFFNGVLFFQV